MGLLSSSVVALVGQTIVYTTVYDGRVYFDMKDDTRYTISPEWGKVGDAVSVVEGSLRDLAGSVVMEARYCEETFVYTITTTVGKVLFMCTGPHQGFMRD